MRLGIAVVAAVLATAFAARAQTVSLNGTTLTVRGLVGVGRLPAALRDEHGETFGSVSGLAAEAAAWRREGRGYRGVFDALPDRGYNVSGTLDYAPRVNRIAFRFTPAAPGRGRLKQDQIRLTLMQSTLLHEALPGGGTRPFTGLDPAPGGVAGGGARAGSPELPQAFNGKLALDAEGIVRLPDGSFLISDEYGPSIYRFSAQGEWLGALPVAASVRPRRNGVPDYSSNNPGPGQPAPQPADPQSGRQNNQGFEGLSLSPDGCCLFAALQSATRQDGGDTPSTRDHTRLFAYRRGADGEFELTGEYVVALPKYTAADGSTRVAAQSELLALSATQLLMLPRDGNGQGAGTQQSLLRRVDLIDLGTATNILGAANESVVAPRGVLDPAVVPARSQRWLDINDNTRLRRFGLVNGVTPGLDNLSEKWEGLALLPALDRRHPDDYFLFVANDNDFSTTKGFQAGGAYDDGKDVDTMVLAFRVTISRPRTSSSATSPRPATRPPARGASRAWPTASPR